MPRGRRRGSKKGKLSPPTPQNPRKVAKDLQAWLSKPEEADPPATSIVLIDVSEASLAKRTYTDDVMSTVPKSLETNPLRFTVENWADDAEEALPPTPLDPVQEEKTVTPEPAPEENATAAEEIKFGFFDDDDDISEASVPDEEREVSPDQRERRLVGRSIWFGDIEAQIGTPPKCAARSGPEEAKASADSQPDEPLPISELASPSPGQPDLLASPPFPGQPSPQLWSVSPIQWLRPATGTRIQELVGGMGLPVTVGERFDPDCYGLQLSGGCVRAVVHRDAACCWAKVLKPLKHECPECFRKDKVSAACIHDLLAGECCNPACPGVHYMNVCHGAVALMLAVVERESKMIARGQSDPNGSNLWKSAREAVVEYHEGIMCHCMTQCGDHLWLPDHLEYTGFPRRAGSVYKGAVEKVLLDHYGEGWCEIVDGIEVGSWK
jgi:hypothetical protein